MVKAITIKDVAQRAGFSIATVSKVLNNKGSFSQETKSKIMQAVNELNYRVNASARNLKTSKTNKIGVIVSNIANFYMMSIAKAVEEIVKPLGYHLLVMSHAEDPEVEKELLQISIEERVAGLIIVPTGDKNKEMIGQVMNQRIPVVLVDRIIEGMHCDAIVDDNFSGSYNVIKYLASLDHHDIGIIHGATNMSMGKERLQGALNALKDFGCNLDQSFIVNGKFTEEGSYKAALELLLLPKPPSAIYCLNNTMTKGLLRVCDHQGINVPDDLSIISFGHLEQWEFIRPALTMMAQPLKRIGLEAAIILKNRLNMNENNYPTNQPVKLMIKPKLIIKDSTSRRE